ncbi:PREDICTED: sperm-associated antigen 7 [Nicrophorus vespilloides]|uniref:Sperm-associated antigen 7 n=1 Tax=Nicrophorus vespilloides TaxID=110193 RepID=A0ABM1ND59_NICVS|nr:PREDICTED: sperm-associated antigen 7 [Nicrophorus vespilloides]
MDLLGSIMNSMDKPPTPSEKERLVMKKRKEEFEKRKTIEKGKFEKFKTDIEEKFKVYFKDPKNAYLKFHPMDNIYRSIVHEVAETMGLISYAFGTDGVDRYIRVYRRDMPPCEDELAARRRGDPWSEQIKQELIEKRKNDKIEEEEYLKRKPEKFVPNSNYKDKYAHLIGQDAALEAAKKTETNKTYGFVPSENKKDQRSIEQTMADIRAKKRLKTSHTSTDASND